MKHLILMIGFMALCFLVLFLLWIYYPWLLKNPIVFIVVMWVCMIGHLFMPHGHKDKEKIW